MTEKVNKANNHVERSRARISDYKFQKKIFPGDSMQLCLSLAVLSMIPLSMLFSQSAWNNVPLQEVQFFFDAGDFNRAASQYKSMLDNPLPPWQQAIITYNLGTAKLSQGKWDEALQIFQSISLEDISLPLLNYRLQINIALTRLLMAKAQSEAVQNDPNASSLADYSSIVRLLREADADVAKAEDFWCQLSRAEGASACEASVEAKEMHIEIKRQYAQVLQHMHDFMLRHASIQEGSITLLASAKAALSHVNFLIELAMEDHLSIDYIEFFQHQDNSWMPFWESVDKLLKQDPDKKKRMVFQKAWKSFSKGIDLMKHRKYPGSQEAFQDSISELNDFVQLVFGDQTADEIVQRILVSYDLMLLNEPLQSLALHSLMEIQALLEIPLKKLEDKHLDEMFQTAQRSLAAALHSMQNNQPIQAKIYTEDARNQILLLSQHLNKTSKNSPQTILKRMIEAQEHALSLNRLRLSMEGIESPDPDIDQLIHRAQSQTVQSLQSFYQAVIDQQKEGLQPSNKDSEAAMQIPWDEVLPPFEAGVKLAQQARELLPAPDVYRRYSIINLQEKTLAAWKEALANMQKKKKSDIKQKEELQSAEQQPAEEKEPQPQPIQPEEQPRQEPGGSSLNDVLRSLQEMENDDRSRPYFKTSGNKEVERPW